MIELADGVIDLNLSDLQKVIPFPNHPCTLSASLAARLYCRRFPFAFIDDVEMELLLLGRYSDETARLRVGASICCFQD